MSIANLNEEEKNLLLQLSYLDINDIYSPGKNINIETLIKDMAKQPGNSKNQRLNNINDYFKNNKNSNLGKLVLIDYENDNFGEMNNTSSEKPSGFVGYAFKDEEGNGTTIFRGSEKNGIKNTIADWGSNAEATLGKEIEQQRKALEFYERNMKREKGINGIKLVLGHSKGGNLATYVYLNKLDENIFAEILNGQPIYWPSLTKVQKEALRGDRYNFIVTTGDIVSYLGMPPGVIDKYVKMGGIHLIDPLAPHYEYNAKLKNGGYVNDSGIGAMFNPMTQLQVVLGAFANNVVWKINISNIIGNIVVDTIYKATVKLLNGLEAVAIKMIDSLKNKISKVIKKADNILNEIDLWFSNIMHNVYIAIKAKEIKKSNGVTGERIVVNTQQLANYEQQLRQITIRIAAINDRIDNLYFKVGLLGMDNILRADIMTNGTWKMNKMISAMRTTREILERNERNLVIKAQNI